jgi:DNA-binding MarR family transcriptional regulator
VPLADLERQLALLARRLNKPVALAGQTVLERPAYLALAYLVDEGPLRPTALAALLEVDLSVVSRQLRALQDAGLVTRDPDPHDARAALVRPTPAGLAALNETRQVRRAFLDEALSGWPEADQQDFARLLGAFHRDLEELSLKHRKS